MPRCVTCPAPCVAQTRERNSSTAHAAQKGVLGGRERWWKGGEEVLIGGIVEVNGGQYNEKDVEGGMGMRMEGSIEGRGRGGRCEQKECLFFFKGRPGERYCEMSGTRKGML